LDGTRDVDGRATADQVRMVRDVATMFDELRTLADRHAELHADRARLEAELASAEAYFYEGRLKLAKQQAKRAKAGLIDGTPNWLRADDILAFQMPTVE